jgi:hypothetical protein
MLCCVPAEPRSVCRCIGHDQRVHLALQPLPLVGLLLIEVQSVREPTADCKRQQRQAVQQQVAVVGEQGQMQHQTAVHDVAQLQHQHRWQRAHELSTHESHVTGEKLW